MIEVPNVEMQQSSRRSGASVVLAVVSIGLCLLIEGAILATRNRFMRLFDEFDVDVPIVTRMAVSPVLPSLLAIVIFAAIVIEFLTSIRSVGYLCSLFVCCVGAGCFAIYLIGVFVPLLVLLESLS